MVSVVSIEEDMEKYAENDREQKRSTSKNRSTSLLDRSNVAC